MSGQGGYVKRLYPRDRAPELPAGMVTMMKPDELDLLYSIARHHCVGGSGCIVDAGVFLGASTACFATGLGANPTVDDAERGVGIHTYERAIVTPAMISITRQSNPKLVDRLGAMDESFAPLLEQLLSEYPAVTLHVGDIMEATFAPQPIQVLFLDILKSSRIQDQCNRLFLPHLVPGHSLIVQQDYFWHFGWFVNAYMERYRDCFELVDSADTTAVFRLVRALPDEAIAPQEFSGPRRLDTLALLQTGRFKGDTLAQYLTYQLCIVAFVMQEMGPLFAEPKLHAFEHRFADILIEESFRPDILRVARAYGEVRNRIKSNMVKPAVQKILP